MEKVYHEMDTKSKLDGEKQLSGVKAYVTVRAYIPKGDGELNLPAIIILEDGEVTLLHEARPITIEYATMPWNHKASEVIREAIRLFDLLRLKVWEKADGE